MREIKYRQPLFHQGKFNTWFYWGFTKGKEHGWTSPQNHQSKNYQFIGLFDKNDKPIYEGDILNVWDWGRPPQELLGVSEVYWDNQEAAWCLAPDPTEGDRYDLFRNIEVIGNTVENPELMED